MAVSKGHAFQNVLWGPNWGWIIRGAQVVTKHGPVLHGRYGPTNGEAEDSERLFKALQRAEGCTRRAYSVQSSGMHNEDVESLLTAIQAVNLVKTG